MPQWKGSGLHTQRYGVRIMGVLLQRFNLKLSICEGLKLNSNAFEVRGVVAQWKGSGLYTQRYGVRITGVLLLRFNLKLSIRRFKVKLEHLFNKRSCGPVEGLWTLDQKVPRSNPANENLEAF